MRIYRVYMDLFDIFAIIKNQKKCVQGIRLKFLIPFLATLTFVWYSQMLASCDRNPEIFQTRIFLHLIVLKLMILLCWLIFKSYSKIIRLPTTTTEFTKAFYPIEFTLTTKFFFFLRMSSFFSFMSFDLFSHVHFMGISLGFFVIWF